MIKKFKLLFSILLIGFFSFGLSSFVNAVVYLTDYGMTLSPSSYSNPLLLENNFQLNSVLGNSYKDFFYVVHNYNSSSQGYYTFGWKGDRLYGYSKSVGCSSNTVYQGYVNKIYKCPCGNPYGNTCYDSATYINTFSDCVFYSDFSLPVFQGLVQDVSKYGYGMITYNDALNVGGCGPVGFMWTPFSSFQNTTSEYWYMIAPDVSDSNNYSLSSTFTIEDVESVINFNSSPLNGSSGGGGTGTGDVEYGIGATIIGSEESAINYFEENYGRDKNICYVGVDNVTTLYGTNGVSFQAGTGLSIFETFNAVYGNSDLDKVYVWLNTWLINYEQWFLRSGDPLYLANYNSGTNQVDIYYDNLTFPFSGKPVAYYFMSDNIEGYNEPQGSEIVSYCNLKINNGTYDEIIDQATKNNIDKYSERSNINIGLNPDGTKKDPIDFGSFTGSAWVSSGVDVQFTGTTTLKNTLENFFNQVDSLFSGATTNGNLNVSSGNSIIPSYIVMALMFVILFKFLRRR